MKLPDECETDGPEARHYDGWTDAAVEALRALLRTHAPVHEISLRTAKVTYKSATERIPGKTTVSTTYDAKKREHKIKQGRDLQKKLEAVASYLRGRVRRKRLNGFWCVFIEHGRDCGWHFHIWTDTPLPEETDNAFGHWWNRKYSGATSPPEEAYCYHSKPVLNVEDFTDYAGKEEKYPKPGRGMPHRVKRRFREYSMGEEGHFLPYRMRGHRKTIRKKKHTGKTQKTHLEAASECAFTHESAKAVCAPNPLLDNDPSASGIITEATPPSYFYKPQAVGVRTGPRYGPSEVEIPPERDWTVGHFQALCAHWQLVLDSIRPAGPGFHPASVEAIFLIPAGRVREFEIEACPPGGFARVFRRD